jgi:hypothetical protein
MQALYRSKKNDTILSLTEEEQFVLHCEVVIFKGLSYRIQCIYVVNIEVFQAAILR